MKCNIFIVSIFMTYKKIYELNFWIYRSDVILNDVQKIYLDVENIGLE